MKKDFCSMLKPFAALLVITVLLVPCTVQAASSAEKLGNVEVTDLPVVTLENWQNSKQEERYSYLLGFVTMLEMEKSWQEVKNPKLYQVSPLAAWEKGVADKTIKDLDAEMMSYIKANPAELNRTVVEFLWTTYAKPHRDEAMTKKPQTAKK